MMEPTNVTQPQDKAFRLEVRDDGIAILTFDTPGVRVNTMNQAVLGEPEGILADLNGDERLDIVVSASVSGDVAVLYNDAKHTFANTARARARRPCFRALPFGARPHPRPDRLRPLRHGHPGPSRSLPTTQPSLRKVRLLVGAA